MGELPLVLYLPIQYQVTEGCGSYTCSTSIKSDSPSSVIISKRSVEELVVNNNGGIEHLTDSEFSRLVTSNQLHGSYFQLRPDLTLHFGGFGSLRENQGEPQYARIDNGTPRILIDLPTPFSIYNIQNGILIPKLEGTYQELEDALLE